MEFDTSIHLRELENFTILSSRDLESFGRELWRIAEHRADNVGNEGNGRFWLDYSVPFKTRYLVCDFREITTEEGGHGYNVIILGGVRAGRTGEILLGFILLFMFWCLSKMFAPAVPFHYIAGLIISAVAGLALFVWCNLRFGVSEAANLRYEIENRK